MKRKKKTRAPHPMDREYLDRMAKLLENQLPDNHGFILFTFPFGDDPDRRLFYVSNAEREDCLNALKEWMIKCGAEEDWMKHLE